MARNFTEGYKGKGYQKRKSRIFQETWRKNLEEIFNEQLEIIKKFESNDEREQDILT